MTQNPPVNNAHDQVPELPDDDGELGLFRLHGVLMRLSLDVTALCEGRRDAEAALLYLEGKDPNRAKLMRHCLRLADTVLDEATHLLNNGIEWDAVEALYCAPENEFESAGFIDTPGHWSVIDQAQAHSERNGYQDSHRNGAAPEPDIIAAPEPTAPQTPMPREPSKAALRRLGRSLRSECDFERDRFFAIADRHGLPTGDNADEAMRAALSELFGEEITSRRQLDATKWSKAASAIETEDLVWTAPTACYTRHAALRL